MMHAKHPFRPGLTAIAAVMALSSTPLLAQSSDAAAGDSAAPVVIASPAPVAAGPTAAPAAAPVATASTPVVHMPDAAVAADAASPAGTSSRTSVRHETRPKPAATATMTSTKTVETNKLTMTPSPAPMATPAQPAPAVVAAEPPRPVPVTTTTTLLAPAVQNDDTLELAAAGGLGLLAIAGGAFLLARRKRREEDVDDAIELETLASVAPRAPAPALTAMTRPVASTPVADPAELPEGFDLSRFGPHVQAAYRGPTADNPSLSLKKRLKRAHFFDQRERMAASGDQTPSTAAPRSDHFMFHPDKAPSNGEPVFQI
jgi:hypothetical protein